MKKSRNKTPQNADQIKLMIGEDITENDPVKKDDESEHTESHKLLLKILNGEDVSDYIKEKSGTNPDTLPEQQATEENEIAPEKSDEVAENVVSPEKPKRKQAKFKYRIKSKTYNKLTEKTDTLIGANEFIESLKDMSADDIAPAVRKKMSARKRRNIIIRAGVLAVCAVVFFVSVFLIIKNLNEGKIADKEYTEMSEQFFDGLKSISFEHLKGNAKMPITPSFGQARLSAEEIIPVIETRNEFYSQLLVKLNSLKNNNPDTYAWIKVDNTNINYPVVQSEDNSYYLNRTFSGEYNSLGAIFCDYECDKKILNNRNTIFYGHNINYGDLMFNNVTKFLNKDFFDNNRYLHIYTFEGIMTYEIFSVYETDSSFHYTKAYFNSDSSFVAWENEIRSRSLYSRKDMAPLTASDKILTLSTCTNGLQTQRYSLHARLVTVEK